MKILITGAAGFTGRYVRDELVSRGHEVFPLRSDLLDIDSMVDEFNEVKPCTVIHLAGIAFVGHGNENDIYNVNLIGSRNLLCAAYQSRCSIEHILLASSANVYGNSIKPILQEQDRACPANDYGVSKYAMELMANTWVDRLPISIVRPFNYTGRGQNELFLIPKIVSCFNAKSSEIELGNIEVWREFNDVRFVAETYSQLIEQVPQISGQVINVCTGKDYSLREIIDLSQNITGHIVNVKINPKYVRKNEVKTLKGDNTLLNKMISLSNQYCLEQTLEWMLTEKND